MYVAAKPITLTSAGFTVRGVTIPEHLVDGLDAHARNGRPTGSFLQACLENNLHEAVSRADTEALQALPAIMGWLYMEAPAGCWGTPAKVKAWRAHGGEFGL